ncbi:MAG: FKBP-type peptidyl-prolyl cis-trans isomerase [Dissulfuribacterales bacterium]
MSEKHTIRVDFGFEVVIEYQIRLKNGKVVDSSEKSGGPVRLICGNGDFPRPVEEGIVGMKPGDIKVIPVPPQYTYGLYDPKQVVLVAAERIYEEIAVGKIVKAPDEFGLKRPAVIKRFWEGAVLLDFNHPLAGQTMLFEVKIRDIDPNPEKKEQN